MSGKTFTLPSFAKINLYLRVLGKRDDGFHELCTVFQTVSLHDDLTFEEDEKLIFTCDDPAIPAGSDNLVVKAAFALIENFRVSKGAKIHLQKNIPAPGGLGGGLVERGGDASGPGEALGNRGQPGRSDADRQGTGVGRAVLLPRGKGDRDRARRRDHADRSTIAGEKYILIVTPDVEVSTREAFARLEAPRLTPEALKSNLKVCRFEAETLDLRHTTLINDFEKSVFETAPEVGRVKERLLELGAVQALMSGSGASVFGIFDKQETRQATLKAIDNEINWRKFAVAAISRDEYREALKVVY